MIEFVGACLVGLASAGPPAAPDELAIDRIAAEAGTVAIVPVRVRDLAGTILNEGDGPDNEIQSFAFEVVFPPAWIDDATFVHAGVTAGRTASFSQVSYTPGSDNIDVIKQFSEATNPLVFTLDAPLPGDVIGELHFMLNALAPEATRIPLDLRAFNAALVDDSAFESETVANGHLTLRHGQILVGSEFIFEDGFE